MKTKSIDSKTTCRIIGIDPGSLCTGVGIIDYKNRSSSWVYHGTIRTNSKHIAGKIATIFAELKQIIATYQPHEMAVEDVFMGKNAASALKLGQARAAAICAGVDHDLPVHEYYAKQIKQSVVGTGGADKTQVQHMVKILLNLGQKSPAADAADALAAALCHAHSKQLRSSLMLRGNSRPLVARYRKV